MGYLLEIFSDKMLSQIFLKSNVQIFPRNRRSDLFFTFSNVLYYSTKLKIFSKTTTTTIFPANLKYLSKSLISACHYICLVSTVNYSISMSVYFFHYLY